MSTTNRITVYTIELANVLAAQRDVLARIGDIKKTRDIAETDHDRAILTAEIAAIYNSEYPPLCRRRVELEGLVFDQGAQPAPSVVLVAECDTYPPIATPAEWSAVQDVVNNARDIANAEYSAALKPFEEAVRPLAARVEHLRQSGYDRGHRAQWETEWADAHAAYIVAWDALTEADIRADARCRAFVEWIESAAPGIAPAEDAPIITVALAACTCGRTLSLADLTSGLQMCAYCRSRHIGGLQTPRDCTHPNPYAWFGRDDTEPSGQTLCLACTVCGQVLKGGMVND